SRRFAIRALHSGEGQGTGARGRAPSGRLYPSGGMGLQLQAAAGRGTTDHHLPVAGRLRRGPQHAARDLRSFLFRFDAVVTRIEAPRLERMFTEFPYLGAAVLWATSRDEAMIVEHLVHRFDETNHVPKG